MGKATGFLDYERQDKKAESPKERICHFREFHEPLTEEEQKKAGSKMHGLRCAVLSGGYDDCRDGEWMSVKQSGVGME